jgi:hypothetical protein
MMVTPSKNEVRDVSGQNAHLQSVANFPTSRQIAVLTLLPTLPKVQ